MVDFKGLLILALINRGFLLSLNFSSIQAINYAHGLNFSNIVKVYYEMYHFNRDPLYVPVYLMFKPWGKTDLPQPGNQEVFKIPRAFSKCSWYYISGHTACMFVGQCCVLLSSPVPCKDFELLNFSVLCRSRQVSTDLSCIL